MSTVLERIATLKQRVEKLEKTWNLRDALRKNAEIGAPFNSPRQYANNGQQTVAEILATAVANGDASLKRKLLESPEFHELVVNASNAGSSGPAARENALLVATILEQAVKESENPAHGPRQEFVPLEPRPGQDTEALAAALKKTADVDAMKATLAKSGGIGHVDLLDKARAVREKASDLLHQARRIAGQ